MTEVDISTKLFNTAVIATKIPGSGSEKQNLCSSRLSSLIRTQAFQVILKSIREHASQNSLSEDQAAEEIISTFREIDKVWDDYIYQEGLSKLKSQLTQQQ